MESSLNLNKPTPLDLISEHKLSKLFITSPNSKKLSKPNKISTSLTPPPSQSGKSVIYKRPRFSNKVSPKFFKSTLHSQTPSPTAQSPTYRNIQAEYLLETLIKNRRPIILPTMKSPKASYKSLKDRLSNTKSALFQNLSSLSRCISEGLKKKNHQNLINMQKSPIRKWEKPKFPITPKKIFKTSNKSTQQVLKQSFLDNSYIITKILDICENEISKWDVV